MKTVAAFRQADLARAVKAARAVGLSVVATEIKADGTIRLEHVAAEVENSSAFDRWKATRAD